MGCDRLNADGFPFVGFILNCRAAALFRFETVFRYLCATERIERLKTGPAPTVRFL
jgi:hypothetical protein